MHIEPKPIRSLPLRKMLNATLRTRPLHPTASPTPASPSPLFEALEPRLLMSGLTTRVSIDSSGAQGSGYSYDPSLSADGRYVAFASDSSNLVAGDTNDRDDIFVHDRITGATTRVSVSTTGVQSNSVSSGPSLSADGRYVVFESNASNLVVGDTNDSSDIFLHDRQTGQTTRISVTSAGAQGNDNSSTPSLSSDGRYVVFQSAATNLVTGDNNDRDDVFVHDLQTGQTTRVSVSSAAAQGNNSSRNASISADGRYVAFQSSASNLVTGDTNGTFDVFVHDRQTGQTARVSLSTPGTQGNSESFSPSLSSDGRYVAFESNASNLVPGDTNAKTDVFVHDRQTGETSRVSVDSAGAQSSSESFDSALSSDGRYVTFFSNASNLVTGDTNDSFDVFVHDRQAGETTRVSLDTAGVQGNDSSSNPSISADGRYVAFFSAASNLVTGDTNGFEDIFFRDREPPAPEVIVLGNSVSITDGDTSATTLDHTNFVGGLVGSTPVSRVFTVRNDGTATLNLSGLTVPTTAGFEIVEGLSPSLAPNTSDTFTVRLLTATAGQKFGQISFTTNDPDENPFNFSVYGVITSPPEVTVIGNDVSIADGDTSATTLDHTNFIGGAVGSVPISRTFTVRNDGASTLNLSGLTVPTAMGYEVVEGLSASLAPNASDTFTVRLLTATAGQKFGQISFTTNDPDENPYNFSIYGVISGPEVTVRGNNVVIADGDTSATTLDHTNFVGGLAGSTPVSRVFTVRNDGTQTLNLSNLVVPTAMGYEVVEGLSDSLAPGASDTFTVRLLTATAGQKFGQISFTTNDSDENPFNFSVYGVISGPEVTVRGNNVVIADGDTSATTLDHTNFVGGLVGSTPVSRVFTVRNDGTETLNLSSLVVPTAMGFEIVEGLASSLAPGASDTFTVRLLTATTGQKFGQISFTTSDNDENPFNFSVYGVITAAAPLPVAPPSPPQGALIANANSQSTTTASSGLQLAFYGQSLTQGPGSAYLRELMGLSIGESTVLRKGRRAV